MDFDHRPRQALDAAVMRLLRPLVRLLLRHGVPYAAFQEMAKRVYVESALEDFPLPGKKPSIARASILTGLTRKDVQRLLAEPHAALSEQGERYNRAARVLTAWIRDPDFLDPQTGHPSPLPAEGELSFATLVRRHSGDMPARAVLDELLRVGAVRRHEDGFYEPIARAYVPRHGALDKLAILGSDVADLIDTIDHNLQHGNDDPRFQRKVMYHRIDVSALPAFRRSSSAQAQALLERLDHWLAAKDQAAAPSEGEPQAQARVGLGIYYFEERLDASRPFAADIEET